MSFTNFIGKNIIKFGEMRGTYFIFKIIARGKIITIKLSWNYYFQLWQNYFNTTCNKSVKITKYQLKVRLQKLNEPFQMFTFHSACNQSEQ